MFVVLVVRVLGLEVLDVLLTLPSLGGGHGHDLRSLTEHAPLGVIGDDNIARCVDDAEVVIDLDAGALDEDLAHPLGAVEGERRGLVVGLGRVADLYEGALDSNVVVDDGPYLSGLALMQHVDGIVDVDHRRVVVNYRDLGGRGLVPVAGHVGGVEHQVEGRGRVPGDIDLRNPQCTHHREVDSAVGTLLAEPVLHGGGLYHAVIRDGDVDPVEVARGHVDPHCGHHHRRGYVGHGDLLLGRPLDIVLGILRRHQIVDLLGEVNGNEGRVLPHVVPLVLQVEPGVLTSYAEPVDDPCLGHSDVIGYVGGEDEGGTSASLGRGVEGFEDRGVGIRHFEDDGVGPEVAHGVGHPQRKGEDPRDIDLDRGLLPVLDNVIAWQVNGPGVVGDPRIVGGRLSVQVQTPVLADLDVTTRPGDRVLEIDGFHEGVVVLLGPRQRPFPVGDPVTVVVLEAVLVHRPPPEVAEPALVPQYLAVDRFGLEVVQDEVVLVDVGGVTGGVHYPSALIVIPEGALGDLEVRRFVDIKTHVPVPDAASLDLDGVDGAHRVHVDAPVRERLDGAIEYNQAAEGGRGLEPVYIDTDRGPVDPAVRDLVVTSGGDYADGVGDRYVHHAPVDQAVLACSEQVDTLFAVLYHAVLDDRIVRAVERDADEKAPEIVALHRGTRRSDVDAGDGGPDIAVRDGPSIFDVDGHFGVPYIAVADGAA